MLLHHPRNAHSEYQARYRGTIRWSRAQKRFEAWCEGRTGYPLVDAGMRQLRREGWMDNRARLVVGSFLTKDLGIDWRWGERWFMRLLLDGDEASNNGNWQWIASVGVDPAAGVPPDVQPGAPAGPVRPRRRYVRRYVPELAGPSDYPEPIVDHNAARQEALARYRASRPCSYRSISYIAIGIAGGGRGGNARRAGGGNGYPRCPKAPTHECRHRTGLDQRDGRRDVDVQ